MSWMWTDDLARMLLDGDDRAPSEPGQYPALLNHWLRRPVALRLDHEDLARMRPATDGPAMDSPAGD